MKEVSDKCLRKMNIEEKKSDGQVVIFGEISQEGCILLLGNTSKGIVQDYKVVDTLLLCQSLQLIDSWMSLKTRRQM